MAPKRFQRRPVREFDVLATNSTKYPYQIIAEPDQIFGLAIRLMDDKRQDAGPDFAVTSGGPMCPSWSLWMSQESKDYLINGDD